MRTIIWATLMVMLLMVLTNAGPDLRNEPRFKATVLDDNDYINANEVLMFISNHGHIGQDYNGIFEIGTGTYFPFTSVSNIENHIDEGTCIYSSSLWIAGKVDGQSRIAVARYDRDGEFTPGPMLRGTFQPDDPMWRTYKLYSDSLTISHSDYAGWPVSHGAPIRQDGTPAMLGDQMLWSVYNDANPSLREIFGGDNQSLGLEIQQTTWAYDSEGALSRCIFLRYQIFNEGGDNIDSCHIGIWCDADIGNGFPSDANDLTGCDSLLGLGYCYNKDTLDAVYGERTPAVGISLLQGPAVASDNTDDLAISFGSIVSGFTNLSMTAAAERSKLESSSDSIETYNYLRGLLNDGQEYDYLTQTTRFMHAGDPVAGTGDLDRVPSEKEFLISAGPFSLAAYDSTEVIFAIVFGQGDNNLESITRMKEANTAARQIYTRSFFESTSWHVSTSGADISGNGSEDYPLRNIQTAVNSASTGDTIWVHPGTYNESFEINKGIALLAYDVSSPPIIQATPDKRVILIDESPDTVIVSGFEIVGGNPSADSYDGRGGGILIKGSPAIIEYCEFYNDTSLSGGGSSGGGGIAFYRGADVIIRNNYIHDCIGNDGGGLLGSYAALGGKILNNVIADNESVDAGGGLFLYNSSATEEPYQLIGNTVYGNVGGRHGFGMHTYGVTAIINRNVVVGNGPHDSSSCESGWGLSVGGTDIQITELNCNLIWDNCGSQKQANLPVDMVVTDSISVDPGFCDTDNGDYHVAFGSICLPEYSPCGEQIGTLGLGVQADLNVIITNDMVTFGRTTSCRAEQLDCNNETVITTADWTWLSRADSVATVDQAGLITSVLPGATYIIAIDSTSGNADSAYLEVLPALSPSYCDTLVWHSIHDGADTANLEFSCSHAPDQAWVHYREIGGTRTDSIVAEPLTPATMLRAGFPSTLAGIRGMEYCFAATVNEITSTLPADTAIESWYQLRTQIPAELELINIPGFRFHMVGFSMELASHNADSIILSNLGSNYGDTYRFGRWEPTVGEYVGYPELDSIFPAHGYWLVTEQASVMGTDGLSTIPDTVINGVGYATLHLAPGWNQIANPFAFEVEWNVRIEDPDYDASFIEDILHVYLPHPPWYSSATILQPFTGYFVNNLHTTDTLDLFIPCQEYFQTEEAPENPFGFPAMDWVAGIEAVAGDDQDQCYVGVHSLATAERDKFDFGKPPAIAGKVRLSLVHSVTDSDLITFGGDFRAPDTTQTWCLSLSNQSGRSATLRLSEGSHLPDSMSIIVHAADGTLLGDLTLKSELQIPTKPDCLTELTIRSSYTGKSHSNDDHQAPLPGDYTLFQNHPNPFNATTEISFFLPVRSQVMLDIYNVMGQRVLILADNIFDAGHHSIMWHGLNQGGQPVASGMYFYSLKVDGGVHSRKMMLLK